MSKTVIKHCNCKNEFQDATYGKGNRVMNQTTKGNKEDGNKVRCTVCKELR